MSSIISKRSTQARVQLLRFPDCPDAAAAGVALRRVLAECNLPAEFEEIDITAPGTPEALARWGSPTILINGKDLVGETPSGPTCRLYATPEGVAGVPPDNLIREKLQTALLQGR
ncbi:MAG: hypothetical protein HYX95_00940 [Chloroflexi bacterium]|nr:hypothetical protein [Chloroflexota bacterium]